MRICFDLDKTLCEGEPYSVAQPKAGAAELLSELKQNGHTILIYTARGMGSSDGNIGKATKNIALLTLSQLEMWGFVYDEIYFGKPSFDILFDDKAKTAISIEQIKCDLTQLD